MNYAITSNIFSLPQNNTFNIPLHNNLNIPAGSSNNFTEVNATSQYSNNLNFP